MRQRVIAAVTALFFFLTFANVADAQKRRNVRHRAAKKPAIKSGAVRTPSGLTFLITEKGKGRRPKAGETVLVHYTGTLTSGVKFDSSRDRNDPIAFKLGAGRVIKGWDEGIARLRIGDRAILVIPPSLGYGAKGAGGVIPPNAKLIFVVELVDIRGPAVSEALFNIGKTGGASAMIARYGELKKTGFENMYTSESDLNGLGYQLLGGKRTDDAIAIFKMIVEEFPNSANAYDSLGEAYVAAGQKQLAIESYQKALERDPNFPSAKKALETLRATPNQ